MGENSGMEEEEGDGEIIIISPYPLIPFSIHWRKILVDRKIYFNEKKDYKRLGEAKMEEWNKVLMKKAREAKTQEQVWKVINKERKRKIEINREIRTEE